MDVRVDDHPDPTSELDRLLEDLKRERKRADTERERFEESRYIADRLQGQEFEARQKAERREWERDRAQEEARRLREELEAERGKGSRRVVIAVLLLIFVVAWDNSSDSLDELGLGRHRSAKSGF